MSRQDYRYFLMAPDQRLCGRYVTYCMSVPRYEETCQQMKELQHAWHSGLTLWLFLWLMCIVLLASCYWHLAIGIVLMPLASLRRMRGSQPLSTDLQPRAPGCLGKTAEQDEAPPTARTRSTGIGYSVDGGEGRHGSSSWQDLQVSPALSVPHHVSQSAVGSTMC